MELNLAEGALSNGLVKEYISYATRNQIGITIVQDSRFEGTPKFETEELQNCKKVTYRRERSNREQCIKEIHDSQTELEKSKQ